MKIDKVRDEAGFWIVVHRGKKVERMGPWITNQKRDAWIKLNLKEETDDDKVGTTLPDSADNGGGGDVASDGEVVRRRPRQRRD